MRPRSEYSKNVVKVMTGATIAQALPIAAAPILTRLFPPEAFGVYYLYGALVSILSVAATGRYEMAILIPKDRLEALHVLLVAAAAAMGFSVLLLVLVLLFKDAIAGMLGEPALAPWLFLLPASVLLQGLVNAGNFWHNRAKRFGLLTGSKILVSTTNVGGRIGMAWATPGTAGLIWGTFFSWIAGVGQYIFAFFKKDGDLLRQFDPAEWKRQALRYRQFPLTMVPGSLFNKGNTDLPPILLNLFFSPAIAGFFGQMNSVVRQPLLVVGRAYEEVFKQKASEELQELGHCRAVFRRTLSRLALLGTGPFLLLFILAPELFAWLFGEAWKTAGLYARYFALPLFLQFLAAPLSSLFYLTEHTRTYSVLELGQLGLVLAALLTGHLWLGDPDQTLLLLAAAYTAGMLVRLGLLWRMAHK